LFGHHNSGIIKFSADSSEILFTLIAPYVPISMKYKLPEKYQSNHCYLEDYVNKTEHYKTCYESKIKGVSTPSISTPIYTSTLEYNIETPNHNYFANGILVHSLKDKNIKEEMK
jgi:hypothetical protein